MSDLQFSNNSNSNNILLVEKMHNVVKYEDKLETLVGSHFLAGAAPDEKFTPGKYEKISIRGN